MKIALLHPQCSIPWWAIKMALMTAHTLQKQGHSVTLYTFDYSPECFQEIQQWLTIEVWDFPMKKEKLKKKNGGFIIYSAFLLSSFFFLLSERCGNIVTLAFHLRHFDMIIANNPPMQIVAMLAKLASLSFKSRKQKAKSIETDYNDKNTGDNSKNSSHFALYSLLFEFSTLRTVWWHHHTPWYFFPKVVPLSRGEKINDKDGGLQPDQNPFQQPNMSIPITKPLSPTWSEYPLERGTGELGNWGTGELGNYETYQVSLRALFRDSSHRWHGRDLSLRRRADQRVLLTRGGGDTSNT